MNPHPDEIADIRQAVRQRRLRWAARGLMPPAVTSREVAVARDAATDAPPHGRRWSVDAEVIDRERLLRGWTQRELASRAGVDQGTLSDLLSRRRRPTLGTVQAICSALRLTLVQAITFDVEGM